MKKKMYYLANVSPNKFGGGISYKIYRQIEMLERSGYDVHDICIENKTGFIDKLLSSIPFRTFKKNINALDEISSSSNIYIRYFFSDFQLIKKLKKIKKRFPNSKILIEIPTYPYDGENMLSHRKPAYWKDVIWRKELYKYVDRIVTFSKDKKIFNIPTINISNGVDTQKVRIRVPKTTNSNTVNLLAVAKFGFWHGYDRMIMGLANYYSKPGKKRNIIFYIVGYGDKRVEIQYKDMVAKYNLQNHVILAGKKMGKELDSYYNICDIAIDSMGRHRSKVYYNSSLKGKEYLAKGLPIVSGVKTELDYMPEFKYYFRVPANDTPVDINKLLEFYDSIYKKKSKEEVSVEIRNFCIKRFDINKCFEPVINWYNKDY